MKFLENDMSVAILKNETDKEKCLEYLKNDKWLFPYIYECQLACVPENSLSNLDMDTEYLKSIDSNFDKLEIESLGFVPIIGNSDNKGFLLIIPDNLEDKWKACPVRYTAFSSICDRAGLKGSTILNDEPKPLLDVLPKLEKAAWLTRGFSLHKANCKILLRDGKISAMLSKDYEIFPAHEIVPQFEKKLKEDYPDLIFESGMLSHEYLLLDYDLNNNILENNFKITLEQTGAKNIDSVKAGVRFTTSDIGYSKMLAAPFYSINGVKMRLGKPLEIRHDNGNSTEKFIQDMDSLGMLFKESEDRIEELGNMDIMYPRGCIQQLSMDRKLNQIPKQIIDSAIDSLLANPIDNCTAVDIFLKLNEMLEILNQQKALSPTRYINMSEEIAKLLYIDFRLYDKPFVEKEN